MTANDWRAGQKRPPLDLRSGIKSQVRWDEERVRSTGPGWPGAAKRAAVLLHTARPGRPEGKLGGGGTPAARIDRSRGRYRYSE
jgi:hypothetical protein